MIEQALRQLIEDLDKGRADGTIYTYGQVQERLRQILAAAPALDDARAEAERRWPNVAYWETGISRSVFIAGAEWQASRPITDEQVEAVAMELTKGEGPLARTHFFAGYKDEARAVLEAARRAGRG